ncbi:hypothetical protein M407DRAFT_11017 [Tulasnella calospora MUT 4182]|uniref:Ubiquitin-like protease family profile domain-containing protein n=1 Tax=Tulasnella calospora MUT 4182 TaxID=1051891 RepID=A0A0C3PY88_9AGAM|nr:hypothetical protein M407DRAFT_11017 [Tulasnella calospora MUT 4182]
MSMSPSPSPPQRWRDCPATLPSPPQRWRDCPTMSPSPSPPPKVAGLSRHVHVTQTYLSPRGGRTVPPLPSLQEVVGQSHHLSQTTTQVAGLKTGPPSPSHLTCQTCQQKPPNPAKPRRSPITFNAEVERLDCQKLWSLNHLQFVFHCIVQKIAPTFKLVNPGRLKSKKSLKYDGFQNIGSVLVGAAALLGVIRVDGSSTLNDGNASNLGRDLAEAAKLLQDMKKAYNGHILPLDERPAPLTITDDENMEPDDGGDSEGSLDSEECKHSVYSISSTEHDQLPHMIGPKFTLPDLSCSDEQLLQFLKNSYYDKGQSQLLFDQETGFKLRERYVWNILMYERLVDKGLNAWILLLNSRSSTNNRILNMFFFPRITENPTGLHRWFMCAKRDQAPKVLIDVSTLETLSVPVHVKDPDDWFVVTVDFTKRTVPSYNSLSDAAREENVRAVPQQDYVISCGIYTASFLETVSAGKDPASTVMNVWSLRDQMALKLARKAQSSFFQYFTAFHITNFKLDESCSRLAVATGCTQGLVSTIAISASNSFDSLTINIFKAIK